MLNDVEHFFMCFWVTMSSLDKCVFRSSTYFFYFIVCFFDTELHKQAGCLFWRLIPCRLLLLQIFSLILRIAFLFCYDLLCCAKTKFN